MDLFTLARALNQVVVRSCQMGQSSADQQIGMMVRAAAKHERLDFAEMHATRLRQAQERRNRSDRSNPAEFAWHCGYAVTLADVGPVDLVSL